MFLGCELHSPKRRAPGMVCAYASGENHRQPAWRSRSLASCALSAGSAVNGSKPLPHARSTPAQLRPVSSIVDHKLDRQAANKPSADGAPVIHHNIRGSRYYNQLRSVGRHSVRLSNRSRTC
jgi:hypothetical protein